MKLKPERSVIQEHYHKRHSLFTEKNNIDDRNKDVLDDRNKEYIATMIKYILKHI